MASLRSRIIQRIMRDTKDALLGDLPVEVRRRRIDFAARTCASVCRGGVHLTTVAANGVPSDWLEPDDAVAGRAILYLHGGAYVICSPSTHRGLAGNIAQASQARLLLIDYRLAPENPFPASLEDALAGYQWLLKKGYSPEHIAIGGDSGRRWINSCDCAFFAGQPAEITRSPLPALPLDRPDLFRGFHSHPCRARPPAKPQRRRLAGQSLRQRIPAGLPLHFPPLWGYAQPSTHFHPGGD